MTTDIPKKLRKSPQRKQRPLNGPLPPIGAKNPRAWQKGIKTPYNAEDRTLAGLVKKEDRKEQAHESENLE